MKRLLILIFFSSALFAQSYDVFGIRFHSNPDSGNIKTRIVFNDPHLDGLPGWGSDSSGVTYIWEVKYRDQLGYYFTLGWADNGDFWGGGNLYYGAHPYPFTSPKGQSSDHVWELMGMNTGADNTNSRSGDTTRVLDSDFGVWFTQALKITFNKGNNKAKATFYINLADTSDDYVIERESDSGWGDNPPDPAVIFGHAPWASSETLSGLLGRIKIIDKALAGAEIIQEGTNMNTLVTTKAQNNIWWGIKSFEHIDSLSCDYGTGRKFIWEPGEGKGVIKFIESVNLAPVVAIIPDQAIIEGSAFTAINLDSYVSDADHSDLEINWEFNGSIELTVNIVDRIATINIPGENWNGTEMITFSAVDTDGFRDSTTALFAVLAVNDPPKIVNLIEQISFKSDSCFILELQSYQTDIDTPDSLLVWNIEISDPGLQYSYNDNNLLELCAPDWSGSAMIFLTLFDDSLAFDKDTINVIVEDPTAIIEKNRTKFVFELNQNYPNPFNPKTAIAYSIAKAEFVELKIYNLKGQLVATLVSGKQSSGAHSVDWDGTNYSSGVYFYRLSTASGFVQSKKLILLK